LGYQLMVRVGLGNRVARRAGKGDRIQKVIGDEIGDHLGNVGLLRERDGPFDAVACHCYLDE